ncbi:AmmeMemoRadiSam system radical SAM enzyme [Candidatus Woesearchaeota archaeon]|nr:AmmeMemoRadiSam system radical SAM enzyme [Candidatus Woesearchaeota archaeon]
MKEADFYKKLGNNKVHCLLCPHFCVISDSERGKCHVRENRAGKLYSLSYGKAISTAVDPIEKKPLFHFMPGSYSYSVATMGCNFKCEFCQNCEISQPGKEIYGRELSAGQIVEEALANGCKSIAYTYTEPTIFYEYAYDIAKKAKKEGLKNIFVTNGFIAASPLKKISPYLDAANIDLKSFSEKAYNNVIGGRLKPVLDSIKLYKELDVFLEITTLIVPGMNDSNKEIAQIAGFIASIDKEIPWHVSRFHPMHHMSDGKITPKETISRAVEIGRKAGLNYTYAGNIPGDDHESTICPACGAKAIERCGFHVDRINAKEGKCSFCGEEINIVQ